MEELPISTIVDVRFFDTAAVEEAQTWGEDNTGENNSDIKASDASDSRLSDASPVNVRQGRPNLQKILDKEIELASGPISVNGIPIPRCRAFPPSLDD
jgi:hypothetical protein